MAAPRIYPSSPDPPGGLFAALTDPTRRSLLARLALGPANVTELARPHRMSLPAVSTHLRILEAESLVSRQVDGRVHRLSLKGAPLEPVEVGLDPFRSYWARTLGDLRHDAERPDERRGAGRREPRSDPTTSGPA